MLWSLINPLAMTAIYVTIFGHTFAAAYGDSGARYGIAVFTGLLVVNFFDWGFALDFSDLQLWNLLSNLKDGVGDPALD
jgi:hypothetical protein